MGVQHVVGGVHAALGPPAELGHQRFVEAAIEGLTVGLHIGAGNAFEGNYQQVARLSGGGQQFLAAEVRLGQANTG
ncbi:hypothetical protein D3C80_1929770 [compost metagenome]